MHFAGLAVEAQLQFFLAIHQDQRFGTDTLDLLRAELKTVAQAVLGDHQRHFACFLLAFVSRFDEADAVFFVEGPRLAIENIAQIVQRRFRVRDGRRDGRAAGRALPPGFPLRFHRLDGLAAQRVECRGRDEPRCIQFKLQCVGGIDRVAQTREIVTQGGQGALGVLGDFPGKDDLRAGRCAAPVLEMQGKAIACLRQTQR